MHAWLYLCGAGGVLVVKGKLDKPVTARISLTYQKAANGLNPNGTRLNQYLVVSEDVLEKAEKMLGYEIERDSIWISYPMSANKVTYTTDFYVNYDGKHDAQEVLEAVLTSWANLFEERYTYNNKSVGYEEPDENTDYIYLVSWLSSEAGEIASYAKTRMKEDNTWSDNGVTFRNIYDSAANLIDVDIENYKTFIVQNGISKDVPALVNSMEYKNKLLSDKKQNYEEQYKNRRNAITLYDPTLFPTISVPSVSSGIYYITTTKTGLDYIYDAAAVASSNSLATQRMIRDDQLLVEHMNAETEMNQENLLIAQETYNQLKQKISELGEKLQQLDKDFNTQEVEPYYHLKIDGKDFEVGN